MKQITLNKEQLQIVINYLLEIGLTQADIDENKWEVFELTRTAAPDEVYAHKIVFNDTAPAELFKVLGGKKSFPIDLFHLSDLEAESYEDIMKALD